MSAYRTDSYRYPWLHRQRFGHRTLKFMMTNERSESWYRTPDALSRNQEYLSLIQPGMNVIDCGANEGYTTVLAAMKSETGKVLAIEPAQHNWGPIQINIALNGLEERVELICSAAGECTHRALFEGEMVVATEWKNTNVPMIHMDALLKDDSCHWHAIKIDVEGYEVRVLKGGMSLLAKQKPVVFLEAHLEGKNGVDMRDFGDSPEGLMNIMHGCGYDCYQDGRLVTELPNGCVVFRPK